MQTIPTMPKKKNLQISRIIPLLMTFFTVFCTFQSSSAISSMRSADAPYKITKLLNIPQNDVNCIFQDKRGFLWFGTLDGLHRYDGYGYKTYRIGDDATDINSNMIIDIAEDRKGDIWVATYDRGICMLDVEKDEFVDYSSTILSPEGFPILDIRRMTVDRNDVMWVSYHDEFYRVMFDEKMHNILSVVDFPIEIEEVKALLIDKNNQLWIGSNAQVVRYPNPYGPTLALTKETYKVFGGSFCELDNGVAAGGYSLSLITKESNDIGKQYSIERVGNYRVSNLAFFDKKFWIGNRDGVVCLEKNSAGKWQPDTRLNGDLTSQGLGSNVVTALVVDSVSGVWIGTRGGGASNIDLHPQQFQHYHHTSNPGSISGDLIRYIFQDSYKNVWVGTEKEGICVLPSGCSAGFDDGFKRLPSINADNRCYVINEMPTPGSDTHKSVIWAGTTYPLGLVKINPETQELLPRDEALNDLGFVFSLEVYDSLLWVGTYNKGVWRLVINDDGTLKSMQQFMPDSDDPKSLSSMIIRSILKDSRGNLWIGTDKGINRIKAENVSKKNPEFEHYTHDLQGNRFNFDYILQIFEDKEGKIWVGTMGGGLLCYNQAVAGKGILFAKITTKEGLPNNTIKAIMQDEQGYLWLTTNNGLSRYNSTNGEIVNYDVFDGLQDNEFSEICGSSLCDGRIIVGGNRGLNVFEPSDIEIDKSKPKLYFTDLFVRNKEVKAGQEVDGRVILTKSIDFTKSISLKYSQNSFSIGFVGVHFNSPGKNNYSYKLEGFDQEWVTGSSKNRIANYTNIPAGRYVFKINASNSDNQWCDVPIALSVRIFPPIYLSWLAFLLYIMFFGFLAYYIMQNRKNKEIERNKLLISELEKKQVEEISLMRQQFFTNVSHEFKTPLTLIKGPIDRLLKDDNISKDDQKENYKLIKQNVRIMMRLISQLMDFRKLDQDKMVLKYAKVEVNNFAELILKSFESWAKQKDLNFSFVGLPYDLETSFDVEKMELVLYNIISNAIKNTPLLGKVQLKIQDISDEGEFAFLITDSGVGISVKDQPHIFKRFFQSSQPNRRNYGGTGVGLAHSKALVELHGGSITFESEEGNGATFFVHLPIREVEALEQSETVIHIEEDIDLAIEQGKLKEKSPMLEEMLPNKKTLLIVDDNYDLRHFIASEFKADFNITLAHDGFSGLEKAEKFNPDVIISDVMMPNMGGIEMCTRLKSQELTSHIPIVMLTSKTSEDSQIEGFETGADAYVAKPFSTDVLRHRINAIIKNRDKLKGQFQKEIKINPMIISNTDADVKFMETILGLIEENISDQEFNVEKLAKAYGVSRVYLSKKIKALTGESTIQFQRSVRLKHAAIFLTQDTLTVSEVAWEVGYNDLNTFRQRFKERFHHSPSEYRKLNTPEKKIIKEEPEV